MKKIIAAITILLSLLILLLGIPVGKLFIAHYKAKHCNYQELTSSCIELLGITEKQIIFGRNDLQKLPGIIRNLNPNTVIVFPETKYVEIKLLGGFEHLGFILCKEEESEENSCWLLYKYGSTAKRQLISRVADTPPDQIKNK